MEESSGQDSGSSRRYSIEELLRLRTSASFVLLNLDTLSTDAETSSILNLPQQAKENRDFSIRTSELARLSKRAPLVERPGNNSTGRRSGSRSLMASGYDEDEDRVIYRGHPSRKDIRETQWQLRRRGASDRSSQPIDAPADILTQRDDNFKAFFQAVRSPTHVRVTAGGRIVPNTRAHPPPQPVFKWNQEEHFFERPKRHNSNDDGQTSAFYPEGVNLPQTDPRPHGNFPTAGSPYLDGLSGMQASGDASDNNAIENTPMQLSIVAPTATDETLANSQPVTSHQGIQISPPENFDLTRPYWFHDRWIVPHLQGSEPSQHQHMLPVNLAGNAGMMHPMYGYLPGAFAPQVAPPGMFFPPAGHAVGMHQPGQQLQYAYPPIVYPGSQPLGNIANGMPVQPAAPGAPLFTSQLVPLMEDPKQRLSRCRDDLKRIDHDLEHNVHQIDKPSKLLQRSFCIAEIQRLEASLNHNMAKQNHFASGFGMVPHNSLRKTSSLVLKDETSNRNILKPVIVDSNLAKPDSTTAINNGPKPFDILAVQGPKDGSREKVRIEPQVEVASALQDSSRARLAAAAATAVFQPRSHKLQIDEHKDPQQSGAAVSEVPSQVQDEKLQQKLEEARLLANAYDWSIPSGMMSVNRPNTGPPVPYSHIAPSRPRYNEAMGLPKMYPYMTAGPHLPVHVPAQVSAHVPAHIPAHISAHIPIAPRAPMPTLMPTPYLRGIQPIGNGEYSYERQLTDDELRARCLYWGKAPRELQRGLPKYNGRDFFPPSPIKTLAKPSRSSEATGQAPVSDPFRDIDYSRTNQGLKDDGNEDDNMSLNSWGEKIKSKTKNKDLSLAHTPLRMKSAECEYQGRFADKVRVSVEDDQSTEASDRQSIRRVKKTSAENKASSSSFLQDMLKNPRYTSSYGTSLDRKEPSFDSLSGNSQPYEEKARLVTPSSGLSMAAALSGTITSATAKGLLPQYRGSATASLAAPNSRSPDKFNSKLFGRFSSNSDVQEQQSPPKVLRNEENKVAPSRLAAAEYLRAVANKERREDQKGSSTFLDNTMPENSNNTGGKS